MKLATAIFSCLMCLACGQKVPLMGNKASTQNSEVVVIGGTPDLRAAIVQDGEELVRSLSSVAGDPSGRPYSVILEIHPAKKGLPSQIARSFRTMSDQENKYRLQVDLRLGTGETFDQEGLNRVLLEMLIIERGLQDLEEGVVAERVGVPAWLLYGLEASMAWDGGKVDRRVYASLVKSGGWMEIEKLVELEEIEKMDALSRDLFQASCCALVRAFSKQSQGKAGMAALVKAAATYEGEPLSLMQTHFSSVNMSRLGLERMWMLQVAAMAQSLRSEAMTIKETEKKLERALYLLIPREGKSAKSPGLGEWAEVLALEEPEVRMEAVRPSSDELAQLSYRSFPTYRQAIAGYLQILAEIGAGEAEEVEERLASIQIFRDAESERYQQLLDLMDWYHLSTVREESGKFEEYLELKKRLEQPEKVKGDPIHEYMDRAQKLFERPKPKE